MFKFLKRKNCDYHIKQIDKCLGSALEKFIRADKYLSGEGFGDRMIKVKAAQGAADKAQRKLIEAYNNYCDGVKDIIGEDDKLGLANVVMKYGEILNIYAIFETDDIRDHWVKEMETFVSQCKNVFNYDELKT